MSLNRLELKKIRRSGIIAPIILSIVGTLHLFKGHSGVSIALYALGATIFIMTRFFPAAFKRVTHTIGESITGLLLSIIFFIVITPFGLVMRLFGKDPLDKKIDKEKDSYWVKKEATEEGLAGYKKQF